MIEEHKITLECDESAVNSPNHYTAGDIECIDALDSMVISCKDPIDACLSWQIVKYVWRHNLKSKPLQDLKKAQYYLNRLIDKYEKGKIRID